MQSVTRDALAVAERVWGRPFVDADIGRAAPNLGAKSEAVHLKSDIAGTKIATCRWNPQAFTMC